MRLLLLCSLAVLPSMLVLAQSNPAGSSDHFVFSTNSQWSDKQLAYDEQTYNVQATKKCKDEVEAPGECYWIISYFKPAQFAWENDMPAEDMPKMRCADEPYAFTTEDINMDGTKEIVALCADHGGWRTVHVFTLGDPSQTSGPFWYEPIGSFGWWAGFEGDRVCDAQIFWMKDKKLVKVLTTDPAEEDFKCTKQEVIPWVLK